MGKEIKEKCKDCVYYNEKMDYPMVDGQTTHLNCMSIKCDYRKATKDLKIVRLKNKIIDLEAKLAESEKDCEELKELAGGLREELIENDCMYKKEIDKLKQQLAEEKNLNKKLNHEAQKYYEDAYCNNFKNQTAIAVLEEMLENEIYLNVIPDFECGDYVSSKIIKTKIEELKNGRN